MANAEKARGSDRASKIAKYEGLPENGKLIAEETRRDQPTQAIPIVGSFVSTMEGGQVNLDNPILAASSFGDLQEKPRFMAKITLFDSHSDDNF